MFEDPINDQLFKYGTNSVVFDHLSDVVPLMNLIIPKRPSLGYALSQLQSIAPVSLEAGGSSR